MQHFYSEALSKGSSKANPVVTAKMYLNLSTFDGLELQENVFPLQPPPPYSHDKTAKSWARNCDFSLSPKNLLLAPKELGGLPLAPLFRGNEHHQPVN